MLRNFAVVGQRTRDHDETWEQPWGEQRRGARPLSRAGDRFRGEERAQAADDAGVPRCTTTGSASAIGCPRAPTGRPTNIAEELTQFRVAADGRAWWAPAFESNREEYLYNATPVSGIATAQTPLTMVLADGTHLSIHEAALVDYSGMNVARVEGTLLKAVLTPGSSGAKVSRTGAFTDAVADADDRPRCAGALRRAQPRAQPQRAQQIGRRELGHAAQICRHLVGDAPRDAELGVGGEAWRDHRQCAQADRLCGEEQIAGMLVEGWNVGWDGDWFANGQEFSFTKPYPDFDLPRIAAYAKRKGVR